MRSICKLVATAPAVFLLGGLPARAADTPAPAAEPKALSDLVVTGRRATADALHLNAPALDLPIAIQVVPIQVIQDQGFVRLGDAVRNVSGVTRKEAYFGLTDSFNVRGFDASTGLFNGFRHDYYGQVADLAHVQSVEVIKGPASVTTGFLEPGGVVNVITKRPTAEPVTEVDLQGGSFGRGRIQGDVSRRLDDHLALRLTGAGETTDSFRDYVGSKRYTVGGALDWTPAPSTKVELSAYYQDLSATPDRGLPNDPVALTVPTSRFTGQPTDSYRLKQKEASAVVEQKLATGWSLRGGFDWSRSDDLRKNTQLEDLQADGRTFTRDYTIVPGGYDTKTAFAEIRGEIRTFGLVHTPTVGVDWTRQKQFYNFGYTADVPTFDILAPDYRPFVPGALSPDLFNGTTKDTGLYLNDLIAVGPYVKLLAGVRRDSFRYGDHDFTANTTTRFSQDATTPRVGIVIQPVKSVSLYANFARSFNPQQFTLLASGQTPAPSKGRQVEAGVKYQSMDGRYTASLAAYEIRKTNVATPDPNDPTGLFSILAGEQRSRGLELDVAARPVEGLQTVLAVTVMKAEVARDEVLPVGDGLVNVPRRQATLWARYDVPGTPFGLGGSLFHVGEREATLPNSFTVPAYTRYDLALFWKATPRIELAVNLLNLTDKRYYDSQDNSLFPGAPRSVLGTVRLSF